MQNGNKMKKLVLMGKSGAGKTSMHSIIFANYPTGDTQNIGLTIDIDESKIKFMGQLTLNLWDCGGQDKLMKQWFTTQKEQIFKHVQVLIYVFDVEKEGNDFKEDIADYQQCISNLQQYSKDAYIFVLIHKFDRIREQDREAVLQKKKQILLEITNNYQVKITDIFGTSIWDETLYKAWSQIVQYLIPTLNNIKENLKLLCTVCECDEIVLFEKQTFLIITYYDTKNTQDILKYERVSNIIKQFKLSCHRIGAQITGMTVKGVNFYAIIEDFTPNTNIMIVFQHSNVQPGAVTFNLQCAKKFFENAKSETGDLLLPQKK